MGRGSSFKNRREITSFLCTSGSSCRVKPKCGQTHSTSTVWLSASSLSSPPLAASSAAPPGLAAPGTLTRSCVVLAAHSYPALCDPMDCSPTSSSVHGILQARILEWVAISFSRLAAPGTSDTLPPKDFLSASSYSEVLLTLTPELAPSSGFLAETFAVCSLPWPPLSCHILWSSQFNFPLFLAVLSSDIHILFLYEFFLIPICFFQSSQVECNFLRAVILLWNSSSRTAPGQRTLQ